MSVILVFLLVVIGVALWWLAQQRIFSKPWLEHGTLDHLHGVETTGMPTPKLGLGVFLAVVGALFALFASAFFMRMEYADWQSLPMPKLLWLNTFILLASSVALHCAVVAARKGHMDVVRLGLATGGLTAFAFLLGQLVVWRQLAAAGYFLESNPANSFFYLLTGVHGLHILGGIIGLGRVMMRAFGGEPVARLRLGVEMCAMYWHFLFFVWVAILVLVAGWANELIAICRQLLT